MGQHRQIRERLEAPCLGVGVATELDQQRAGWDASRRQEAAHAASSLYPALHKVGELRDFK